MSEYAFNQSRAIPSGRVLFRVRNQGTMAHELQLFSLADDFPPILEQLRGSERRVLNALAGVPRRESGATGIFSVELEAGKRYALICFLVTNTGSHAVQGMASEFVATAQ